METKDIIEFEITGNDLKNVKKFRKQHKNCPKGMACEQFEYSFIPTGLGLVISVKCSCGQKLILGNFMDYESGEYDKYKNRVLTEEDHKKEKFEEAALLILQWKDPKIFRLGFLTDQSFELIYAFAVGVSWYVDERIKKCILWKREPDVYREDTDNYRDLDDAGKIEKFYMYFEEGIKAELKKTGCSNERLKQILWGKHEG